MRIPRVPRRRTVTFCVASHPEDVCAQGLSANARFKVSRVER